MVADDGGRETTRSSRSREWRSYGNCAAPPPPEAEEDAAPEGTAKIEEEDEASSTEDVEDFAERTSSSDFLSRLEEEEEDEEEEEPKALGARSEGMFRPLILPLMHNTPRRSTNTPSTSNHDTDLSSFLHGEQTTSPTLPKHQSNAGFSRRLLSPPSPPS